MPPDSDQDDDIIEISFDDDEGDASSSDDEIEIVFHDDEDDTASAEAAVSAPEPLEELGTPAAEADVGSAPEPPAAPTPRPPPAALVEEEPPESGQKYCPECGFALPPLATECPRCARLGIRPRRDDEAETELPPVAGPGTYPSAAARPRSRVGLIVAALVMIAIAIAIPIVILNSPGYKARAAYREAVKAQLVGDLDTAKAKYREALEHNPDMGLAAFGLGTCHLGISLGGRTDAYVQQLLDAATGGVTTELDEADRWLDHAIVLANKMPANRALHDPNISTPRKLASYAHAMKAMSAFIRYYAAVLAGDDLIAQQWMQAAAGELRQALALDPTNPDARDLSDRLTP